MERTERGLGLCRWAQGHLKVANAMLLALQAGKGPPTKECGGGRGVKPRPSTERVSPGARSRKAADNREAGPALLSAHRSV